MSAAQIIDGCRNVLIARRMAARISDKATCIGPRIQEGSRTVLIGGNQAARIMDKYEHGGYVAEGCETFPIGE